MKKHILMSTILVLVVVGLTSCFLDFRPESYNITYNYNYIETGKNAPTESVYVVIEGSAAPAMFIQREGYTFKGWYKDTECTKAFDFTMVIEKNITLYAKWLGSCKVTFDYNYSGSPAAYETTVVEGSAVANFPATRVGYALEGWYTVSEKSEQTEETKVDFTKAITKDETYYAKWTDAVKITYNYNDGVVPTTEERYILRNTSAEKIKPEREGYIFDGWYTTKEAKNQTEDFKVDFANQITEDKVFYAKWLNNWKVSFNYNYEGSPESHVVNVADKKKVTAYQATRNDYALLGWYTEKDEANQTEQTKVDFDKEITKDETYYAKWTTDFVKVSYNYNEGSNPTVEDRYIVKNTSAQKLTPERTGYIFAGWYAEAETQTEITFDHQLTEDVVYFAKWLKNCKVTFNYNYVGAPASYVVYVKEGEKVGSYLATRTNYALDGWYTEFETENKVDFETKTIEDDIVLYAKWTTDVVKVSYNYNIGLEPTVDERYILKSTSAEDIKPQLTGYVFDGWYEEKEIENKADFTKALSENKTYYAKWLKNCKVTFNYNYSGSPIVYETYVVEGKKVQSYQATRAGYALDGWYTVTGTTEGTEVDFNSEITEDKIYYAKWTENVVKVTYNYNYSDNPETEERYVVKNTTAENITPQRDGYVFAGWYTQSEKSEQTESNKVDFSVQLTSNKTYFAKWLKNCKVTFNYNYLGSPIAHEVYVVEGQKATSYPANRPSYGLEGWYTKSEEDQQTSTTKVDFTKAIEKDVTYYAKWSDTAVAVTYDLNYDSKTEVRYIASGTTADNYTPERENYYFEGWYKEAGATNTADFSETLTASKTYYAKWTRIWTVKFDYNYEDSPVSYEVKVRDKNTVNSYAASRNGYALEGWYTEKEEENQTSTNKVNFSSLITKDETYYAKWTSDVVKVTYDYNYDSKTEDRYVIKGTTAENIQITRTGYTFKGWYKEATGTTAVDFAQTVKTGNTYRFYAKWEPISYTIEYKDKGGVEFSGESWNSTKPVSHTYGKDTTLALPEKTGYTFKGWYIDSGCTTSAVEVLGSTDYTTNITLYAKWEGKKYTVTFVNNTDGSTVPSPKTMEVTYGSAYGALASTKKENWTFEWHDAQTDGNLIDASTIVDKAYDHTLYAQGIATILEITYNSKDDSLNPTITKRYIGRKTTAENIVVTREGYVFDGWYVEGTNDKVNFEIQLTEDQTYYAKWLKNCKVTFNYGTGSYDSYVVEGNKVVSYPATKTGYTLEGWYTSSTTQDSTTKVSFEETISTDTVYYAKWTPAEYTVTFNANGGTNLSSSTINEIYNTTYTLPTITAPIGYTFKGWYTTLVEGTKITETTVVDVLANNQTLYAQWTANTYTVTFDKNDTDASALNKASMTVTYGQPYGSLATTSKANWSYCWVDENNNIINSDTLVTQTKDHTLKAKWTQNILTITYIYNYDNLKDYRYIAINASAENVTPVRPGYIFNGWYTSEDVKVNFAEQLTKNQTYYAKWLKNCKVTFDYGTGSYDSYVVEGNKVVSYPATKTGYTLEGWYTSSTTQDSTTKVSFEETISTDTVYYAKWTPNKYAVTFKLNYVSGSSPTDVTKDQIYGSTYSLPMIFPPTGYTLDGWYTAQVGGIKVEETTVVGTSANGQVLNAHWTAKTYTVTFDKNDTDASAVSKTSMTVTYGQPYGNLATTSKANWSYYWEDESGNKVDSNTIVKLALDHTLKAKWTQDILTITYELNYDDLKDYRYIAVNSSAEKIIPERTGYVFDGWYQESGTTNKVNFTQQLKTDKTYYAKWSPAVYDITYKDQGNVPLTLTSWDGNNPDEHTYGTETSLVNPIKTGYDFGGWYTDKTCSDDTKKVTKLTATGYTKNITLYAKWTPKNYTVTFNANGGTNLSSATKTETFGSVYSLPTVTAPTGYSFNGWYTAQVGGTKIEDSTLVGTSANNQTLYAHWTANTYKVTFITESGTLSKTEMNVVYGQTYGELATVIKDNWSYAWYDSSTGGNKITANSVVSIASNHNLYALLTQDLLTVTYNLNYESKTTVRYVSRNLSAENITVTRPGYDFVGWYTDVGTTNGKEVNFGSKLTADATYYAKWTPAVYTITYKDQGNVNLSATSWTAANPETHTYNKVGGTTLVNPIRTGYDFGGWYTDSACVGTAVTVLGATAYTDDIVLYAKWTPHVYTITYKDKGNTTYSGTDQSGLKTSHTYGTETTLTDAPNETKAAFVGWYTDQACTEVNKVTKLDATKYTQNIVLYAKWAPYYAISYFDKSTSEASKTAFSGDSSILPSLHVYGTETELVVPTKTGYMFGGWYAEYDCSGNALSSLGAISYNADITLYAMWTPITYTVSFVGNGSNGGTAINDQSFTYDVPQTLSSNTFTKTGYHLAGWSTTSDGSAQYTYSNPVNNLASTNGANVKLYAIWAKNTYTLSYMDEGTDKNYSGSNKSSLVATHTYDTAISFVDGVKTGYIFGGWYSDSACTAGKQVTGQSSLDAAIGTAANEATITLYAKWAPIKYTISFDKNGADGTQTMSSHTQISYDATITLNEKTYTKTGYTFSGWAKKNDSTTADYADKATVSNLTTTDGATVTLYAIWTPITYSVSFDANYGSGTAGTGSMSNQTFTYDKSANLTSLGYQRPGYTFQGWSKTPSTTNYAFDYADGAQVSTNLSSTKDATVTLYAIWKPKTYTIVYKESDGSAFSGTNSSSLPSEHVFDASITMVDGKKPGYKCYWYSDASCSDASKITSKVSLDTVCKNTSGTTITLYAKWTEDTYTITYKKVVRYDNSHVDIVDGGTDTYTYGTEKDLSGINIENYTFAGWCKDYNNWTPDNSIGKLTKDNCNGDLTLYAIFVKKFTINSVGSFWAIYPVWNTSGNIFYKLSAQTKKWEQTSDIHVKGTLVYFQTADLKYKKETSYFNIQTSAIIANGAVYYL